MGAPSKQTLGMFALAGIVIVVGLAMLAGVGMLATWNVHGRGLSSVSAFTGNMGRGVDAFLRAFNAEDPVHDLQQERSQLESRLAELQDVEEENAFLRRIADLPARGDRDAVVGNIFTYSVVGQELRTVLNRGEQDGIILGSTVVTEAGALLGIVSDVRERSSVVRMLGDPAMQVTGRILGTQIGGLVHVDHTGRLALDLIGKDESVAEGAVVVASGLDTIPAGLRIGTVRSVDAERTTLFQIIRIDPAHGSELVWRVLVLIP